MLVEQTMEKLVAMRLKGMAQALRRWMDEPKETEMTPLDLAQCRWVEAHQNVLLTGQTGVGKSYLACALGQKACREGYSVAYRRASRLLDELTQARADGTTSSCSAAQPGPTFSSSMTLEWSCSPLPSGREARSA